MTLAAQESGTTTGRPRRPRRSTLLIAASVVLEVALLLWGADRLARWGAESVLTDRIAVEAGVATRPDVDIESPFFLLQAVRGRYDDVQVTLEGLGSGPLRIERLHAELSGVHLPFSNLVTRSPVPVRIERSREEATLRYEDLNDYLAATGRPVRIESAAEGTARLTGSVGLLGREVSASARAELAAEDGRISVRPTQLDTGTALDRASALLLQQRFAFAVPMDPLPFGQRLTDVDAQESHLVVEARGSDIVVNP